MTDGSVSRIIAATRGAGSDGSGTQTPPASKLPAHDRRQSTVRSRQIPTRVPTPTPRRRTNARAQLPLRPHSWLAARSTDLRKQSNAVGHPAAAGHEQARCQAAGRRCPGSASPRRIGLNLIKNSLMKVVREVAMRSTKQMRVRDGTGGREFTDASSVVYGALARSPPVRLRSPVPSASMRPRRARP